MKKGALKGMLGCNRGYLDGSFFSEQTAFRGGGNFP